jgi:Winged helix DNA-binding domain
MLAMQAQDYGQAVWAIGARIRPGLPAGTLAGVEQAIATGQIVRTWPMRGTIHWVAPADVRWLLRLCGSRQRDVGTARWAQLGLTGADLGRAGEVLAAALMQRPVLTRAEAMQALDDGGLAPDGQRGYHLLLALAHQELICFGPMQGKQQTFVLLDHWVPPELSRDLAGDEALAELALRYAVARGPVTARDLAHWAGITLTSARRGFAAAGDALARISVDDVEYFCAPAVLDQVAGVGAVLLLPGFDEYLLGYRDRSAQLAAEHFQLVVPGGNGVFRAMIVQDGQIIGTWQRSVRASDVRLTMTPFHPGAEVPAGAAVEAQRYAGFLGLALRQSGS